MTRDDIEIFSNTFGYIISSVMTATIIQTTIEEPYLIAFFTAAYFFILHFFLGQGLMSMLITYDLQYCVEILTSTIKITFFDLIYASYFNWIKNQEINQTVLQIKEDAVDALNKSKLFLLGFSHELRNPLNCLLGNIHLLLEEKLEPNILKMVKSAEICGEFLQHFINNILDSGKAEMGLLEINPVEIDVRSALRKIWTITGELIKSKGLKGSLRIDNSLPIKLIIDPYRLTQIFLNLISNSTKFTSSGEIIASVYWEEGTIIKESIFKPYPYEEDEDDIFLKNENCLCIKRTHSKCMYSHSTCQEGLLKIIIRDTGPGMTPDSLNKIFQKFSQVSENQTHRQVGTGLGLFLTHELCKNMGGDIRAFSEVGKGSTFVALIPCKVAEVRPTPLQLKDIERKLNEMKLHVLVADGNNYNIELFRNYFKKISGEVVAGVNEAKTALDSFINCRSAGQKLHLVILDIDMSGGDGLNACKLMRKYERDHNLISCKIIFVSENKFKSLRDIVLDRDGEYRANLFLYKPISFVDLLMGLKYLFFNK